MKMYLNNKSNEPITIANYNRNLDIPSEDIRFKLDVMFEGNYPAAGIEYLANYANENITSILIESESGNIALEYDTILAKLTNLYENGNDEGKNGYASIDIYEDGVTL